MTQVGKPGPDRLRTWRFLLGDELLAFLVGATVGPLDEGEWDESPVGEVVEWLCEHAGDLQRVDPRLPVALVRAAAPGGLPIAWSLRVRGGAALPEAIGDDDACRLTTEIARDAFPVLLAPSELVVPAGPGRSLPASGPEIALSQVVAEDPRAPGCDAALRAAEPAAASGTSSSRP